MITALRLAQIFFQMDSNRDSICNESENTLDENHNSRESEYLAKQSSRSGSAGRPCQTSTPKSTSAADPWQKAMTIGSYSITNDHYSITISASDIDSSDHDTDNVSDISRDKSAIHSSQVLQDDTKFDMASSAWQSWITFDAKTVDSAPSDNEPGSNIKDDNVDTISVGDDIQSSSSSLSIALSADKDHQKTVGPLWEQLMEERKRKDEALFLLTQLQKNYDEVLVRYAGAKNTIDSLRFASGVGNSEQMQCAKEFPSSRICSNGIFSKHPEITSLNLSNPTKASSTISSPIKGRSSCPTLKHSSPFNNVQENRLNWTFERDLHAVTTEMTPMHHVVSPHQQQPIEELHTSSGSQMISHTINQLDCNTKPSKHSAQLRVRCLNDQVQSILMAIQNGHAEEVDENHLDHLKCQLDVLEADIEKLQIAGIDTASLENQLERVISSTVTLFRRHNDVSPQMLPVHRKTSSDSYTSADKGLKKNESMQDQMQNDPQNNRRIDLVAFRKELSTKLLQNNLQMGKQENPTNSMHNNERNLFPKAQSSKDNVEPNQSRVNVATTNTLHICDNEVGPTSSSPFDKDCVRASLLNRRSSLTSSERLNKSKTLTSRTVPSPYAELTSPIIRKGANATHQENKEKGESSVDHLLCSSTPLLPMTDMQNGSQRRKDDGYHSASGKTKCPTIVEQETYPETSRQSRKCSTRCVHPSTKVQRNNTRTEKEDIRPKSGGAAKGFIRWLPFFNSARDTATGASAADATNKTVCNKKCQVSLPEKHKVSVPEAQNVHKTQVSSTKQLLADEYSQTPRETKSKKSSTRNVCLTCRKYERMQRSRQSRKRALDTKDITKMRMLQSLDKADRRSYQLHLKSLEMLNEIRNAKSNHK